MTYRTSSNGRKLDLKRWLQWAVALLCISCIPAAAQVVTATLNGTVADETGAVIPGATVTVTNQQSNAKRTTTSNGEGLFSFPALPAGDYRLLATAANFEKFEQKGIHLDPGDTRTDRGVKMKIGAAIETVTVDAGDTIIVSNGERSVLISEDDIKHLSTEGRGVDELLKILPGAAIATSNLGNAGASNSSYDPGQVSVGGASGSYSMSGSPTNGVTVREDGANLSDPGSYNASTQTVNMDMTSEVKIESSNFGADVANGPVVVTAVGKSGGADYHGQVYVDGRTYMLNSADAFFNALGQSKPEDRYMYPGAQIGGPVRIPHTDFNHSKKLTFWVGAEDQIQRNVYAYGNASSALQRALVPTANMRKGIFNQDEITKYLPAGALNGSNTSTGCPTLDTTNFGSFSNVCYLPGTTFEGADISTTHVIPGSQIDPGAQIMLDLMPLPNTPNGQTVAPSSNSGYNYIHQNLVNNDLYQIKAKVELAATDNDHFSVSYGLQRGVVGVPQSPYYYASGNSGAVNFPGGSASTVNSHTLSLNYTRILSATKTNEFFINGVFFVQNFKAANPKLSYNSLNGYPYNGPYNNGSLQMPSLSDYGYDGLPLGLFPDFTTAKNGIFARKWTPGIGDNFSWSMKTVTLKAGFQMERPENNEMTIYYGGGSSGTNGWVQNYYVGQTFTTGTGAKAQTYYNTCAPRGTYCNGPGNLLASFLGGEVQNESQYNVNPQVNTYWWNPAAYATADWKVTKNLTFTVGARVEHVGMWNDAHGKGIAVWNAADANNTATTADPLPGFSWHAQNKSIPVSGVKSRLAFVEPRFGMSWDVYGNGHTVFRGGWGQYRFHDNWGDVSNGLLVPDGLQTTTVGTLGTLLSYASSLQLPVTGGSAYNSATAGVLYGLDPKDNDQPMTTNYSATLEQRAFWGSLFSIAYVGNQSTKILNDGSNEAIAVDNANAIPLGGLFKPNPNKNDTGLYGVTISPTLLSSLTATQINDWRTFPNYGEIQVLAHKLWANYNGLQVAWNKQKGRATFGLNYTWSKALGVHGGYYNGIPGDSFNLHNDYGVLAYDRSHIVNANYWFDLGKPIHNNRALGALTNNWQLSGITGFQTGPNLQASNYNSNFGLSGSVTGVALGISNEALLGTADVSLQPRLVCNPTTGLAKHQYMNGNCFRLPVDLNANGEPSYDLSNGPFNFPYIHGPIWFNSDLTVMKDFHISEGKTLQIRGAAFNFLNHPLRTFTSGSPGATQLQFNNLTTSSLGTSGPSNASQFGYAAYTSGRRVTEIYIKYNF